MRPPTLSRVSSVLGGGRVPLEGPPCPPLQGSALGTAAVIVMDKSTDLIKALARGTGQWQVTDILVSF